jgi:hypothetical protein
MPLTVPALETSGLWKPTLHLQRNVRGDLCHPEWRWVWQGMRFLAPLWEMGGDAQDVISGIRGTPTGTPGWARDVPGETATFNGTPFWIFNGVSIAPARPITVLVVLRPDQNTTEDRAATANAGTASNQAWAVWTHNITTGVGALRLINWSLSTPEISVGTMTAGTWYAGAMTTDRQGGTPLGAMLNLSTRALTTATGTQQTLPTQQDNPLIANAPTTTQAGGGPYQFVGALALVAWLPGVAWSERQLIQWVHDPFAFLIPARRLWALGFVPAGGVTVSASASPPWEAVARVSPTSRVGPWEAVARLAPVARSAPWESLARVAPQSGVSPWESVTRATAATTGPWEGLARASTARAVPWEGLGRMVRPGSVAWESIKPVSRSLTSAWEGLSRVVKTAVGAWESGGLVGVLRSIPWEAAGQAILRRLRTLLWVGE